MIYMIFLTTGSLVCRPKTIQYKYTIYVPVYTYNMVSFVKSHENLLQYIMVCTINPYSTGIDFSRQNLTSVEVKFWRLKSIPAL